MIYGDFLGQKMSIYECEFRIKKGFELTKCDFKASLFIDFLNHSLLMNFFFLISEN